MDENELGGFEGHGQRGREAGGEAGDFHHRQQLPEAQVFEKHQIKRLILHQRLADVDVVLHTVGFETVEVVRKHQLGLGFFLVQKVGHGIVEGRHAHFKIFAALVQDAERVVDVVPVFGDGGAQLDGVLGKVLKQRLDLGFEALIVYFSFSFSLSALELLLYRLILLFVV